MRSVLTLLAFVAGASAQNVPAIEASGNSLVFNVPRGGNLRVRYDDSDTILYSDGDDPAELAQSVQLLQTTVNTMAASIAQLTVFKEGAERCGSEGRLYDADTRACLDASGSDVTSLVERLDAVEDNIDAVEQSLNGTDGSHSFCAICSTNQYAAVPCNDEHQTICQACEAGKYSRGGAPRSCTSCASQVANCYDATCTTRDNAQCQSCNQMVARFGNPAMVLTGNNSCGWCPAGTYRQGNATCTACSKDDTCASANCQPAYGAGDIKMVGVGQLSTIYAAAVRSLSQVEYLALGQDGDTTWNRPQLHTTTSTAPWYTQDLGPGVEAVSRIVIYNRYDGNQHCRLFAPYGDRCVHAARAAGNGAVLHDADDEGAFIGLSDRPFDQNTAAVPTTTCTAGGRNCVCSGKLIRTSTTNRYELNCQGATGRYAYVLLPGANRILNFNEIEVYGRYRPGQSASSVCTTQCAATGCKPGFARCSGGMDTAVCTADGCVEAVTDGVAFGFRAATQQCVRCTSSQWRTGQGVCQTCPAACPSNCQVTNSLVDGQNGGSSSLWPRQYEDRRAGLAQDGDPDTFMETVQAIGPWYQYDMGTTETIAYVDVWNRPDTCAARLFQSSNACNWAFAPPGTAQDRVFDGESEGAIIRISDQPCTNNNCPGQECGRITRPGAASHQYQVRCTTPVAGRYVSLQLPGRRLLQIAELNPHRDTTQPQC